GPVIGAQLERLKQQSLVYQLGADDMGQAIADAVALREEEDRYLMLALEWAMAVCYMLAFQSGLRNSGSLNPPSLAAIPRKTARCTSGSTTGGTRRGRTLIWR